MQAASNGVYTTLQPVWCRYQFSVQKVVQSAIVLLLVCKYVQVAGICSTTEILKKISACEY